MKKRTFVSILAGILCIGMLSPMSAAADEEEEEEEEPYAEVYVIPADETTGQAELGYSDESIIIEVDGLKFKDLNKNGELDVYEDYRCATEERVENLLSLMENEEKANQMIHVTLASFKDKWFADSCVGFALAYAYLGDGIELAVQRVNYTQSLCESSTYGIPVIFSMDSVIGASWVNGTTIIPDQITLAATGDVELVEKLADAQRTEMKALGIRMSLSPSADLATDPRWGRAQECFGEDADTAIAMVTAVINGLQGGSELTADSVMTCVKHFPGSGPQTGGVDGTPIVLSEDTIDMHLSVFKAAIEAGAASIMPYGYSSVPFLGGDAVDNVANDSATVMTDLLRGELGYTGIIQNDWGYNFTQSAKAGADALGGASTRVAGQLLEDEEYALTEEELNEKVGRLLTAKFNLGIFENPYSDVDYALSVVGTEENHAIAKQAAAEAITLVKYENAADITGKKIVVAGHIAENAGALSSNWKINETNFGEDHDGTSILDAIIAEAGEENVTYIGDDLSLIPEAYDDDTVVILVVGEVSGTHEPEWGADTLEFPEDQIALAEALRAASTNVIGVAVMNRAYVMTPIADNCDSLLLTYKPGMTDGAYAIADALFGKAAITGHTPYQVPATMDQVLLQREDAAKDITDPLYDYGYGIEIEAFGK